ncbi:MAG TPA: hypothetical protein VMF58_12190 [Rhizomicrobium sp.]|nr:hypothetical protein [Rhizomicrobium sp.]
MKALATAALAASLLASTPSLSGTNTTGHTAMTDHAHDFDFLIGKWKVHHWRLKDRLAGSTEWVEFDGTSTLWMTMDGHGTVDDNFVDLPGSPYRAVGIRGYDPKKQTWSIFWLDGRDPHEIGAPVIGNFQNGVGTFEGDDTFNGKPIRVRYTWSRITPTSAHWEQAFSPDAGKTWEVNWRMDFTRAQ